MINNLNEIPSNKAIVDGQSFLECLTSQVDKARIKALLEALQSGDSVQESVVEIVKNETGVVQSQTFDLLWESADEKAKQKLLKHLPLRSKLGVDYTLLRNLLARGQWEEADAETKELMLKVAGREKEGLLDRKSSQQFPCEDLCIIDHLWVKYSGGRFGFSVQKCILENLLENQNGSRETSGNEQFKGAIKGSVNPFSDSISFGGFRVRDSFATRVGWRVNGEWLRSSELTFNLSAPEGHLPSPRIATPSDLKGGGEEACQETIGRWCGACCFGSVWCGVLFFGWWSILDRIQVCPCQIPMVDQSKKIVR
ncbi:MAG TPA: hypothetical protein DD379_00185 [Cyanobacteria bacterium UBA11162]|nr:hypothetical protein [Cyanobacteria bacterium UBA11162]